MLYKTDVDEARCGLTAWWRGEDVGRPVLGFRAPRDEPLAAVHVPPEPAAPRDCHLDMDYVLAVQEAGFARERFFGDLIPYFDVNIGPGSMATYLGSEPGFDRRTVWYNPCIDHENPEGAPLPVFDDDNPWWRRHLDMVRAAADRARGRCLASIPDLIEGLDIVASLRGTMELLYDLNDRADWVKRWVDRIGELYFDYFDPLYEIVKDEDGGCAFTAFHIWAPGRMAKVQCDFAYMIGPETFAEFAVPALERQCDRLDYSVFHLDGPACIRHVPHLVGIESLNAIQWTPGAGNPDVGDPCWYDLYHRVLDGGKSLLLIGTDWQRAERVAAECGTRGIFFVVSPVASEAEGEALLARAASW